MPAERIKPAAREPIEADTTDGKRLSPGLGERLASLRGLPFPALRAEWRRLHRTNPPMKMGRDVLELGIAWKLQETALGGMSAALKRRLLDLAQVMESKGDLTKRRSVRLKPGARLVREWRGETHDVLVVEDGYLWKGQRWRSLSLIAREITGTRWSGPRFFGLKSGKGSSGWREEGPLNA